MTKALSTNPRKRAKERAWPELSKAIRLEGSDEVGYCTCVTCGAVEHWKDVDAGHWCPGRRESILFDERHIFCQCRKCNRYHHQNPWGVASKARAVDTAYDAFMLEHQGQEIMADIKRLNRIPKEHTTEELEGMRAGYIERWKAAKHARGL